MDDDNQSVVWTQVWAWLTNARLIRFILLFGLGWATIQVLSFFQPVIVVFTFAAILAFLLSYPVRWAATFVPRSLAVIAVSLVALLLLSGLVVTIGFTVLAQGQQLLDQSPEWVNTSAAWLEQLQQLLTSFNLDVDLGILEDQVREQAVAGLSFGLEMVQRLLLSLIDVILVVVIAFFMLLDGDRLWNYLIQSVPVAHQDRVTDAVRQNLLGFFWGRFLLSLFFGVSCLITFLILQTPYPLLLAAIGGLFDLIPGIGATLGVSLIAVILLPQGILLSLMVVVGCILLQQVEENLLMPHVMQGSINMNPVVMFFALLVGFQIAGVLGLFLSIPTAGVIISLFNIDAMKGKQRS